MLHFSTRPSVEVIAPLATAMLHAVLDHVGFGMAVVDANTCQLLYANAQAQQVLQRGATGGGGLHLIDGVVTVKQCAQLEPFNLALARTKLHQRSLLTFNAQEVANVVAVLPLSSLSCAATVDGHYGAMPVGDYALLLFAKPQVCDNDCISLDLPRSHGHIWTLGFRSRFCRAFG